MTKPSYKSNADSGNLHSMLEGEEGDVGSHLQERAKGRIEFPPVDNEERKPRSEEEMSAEAEQLAHQMEIT